MLSAIVRRTSSVVASIVPQSLTMTDEVTTNESTTDLQHTEHPTSTSAERANDGEHVAKLVNTEYLATEYSSPNMYSLVFHKRPLLIDRAMLKYKYGILPATPIPDKPATARKEKMHRHTRYKISRQMLNRLNRALPKDAWLIEDVLFSNHRSFLDTLCAEPVDAESLRQLVIFDRALDAIRTDCEPEYFNARKKALEFQYFRWLYHASICMTPPTTLTPKEIDRLHTAGFITDEELDFLPALTLLAAGAQRRSEFNAMFLYGDIGSVPVRMRWTTGFDERPTASETRVYIDRQEKKRSERPLPTNLRYHRIRPQVTEEWEEYHERTHGRYGLKQFGVADEEAADLIYEDDFTFIDPRQPPVEPANLVNFGTPPIQLRQENGTNAIAPTLEPLPINLNLIFGLVRDTKAPPPTTAATGTPAESPTTRGGADVSRDTIVACGDMAGSDLEKACHDHATKTAYEVFTVSAGHLSTETVTPKTEVSSQGSQQQIEPSISNGVTWLSDKANESAIREGNRVSLSSEHSKDAALVSEERHLSPMNAEEAASVDDIASRERIGAEIIEAYVADESHSERNLSSGAEAPPAIIGPPMRSTSSESGPRRKESKSETTPAQAIRSEHAEEEKIHVSPNTHIEGISGDFNDEQKNQQPIPHSPVRARRRSERIRLRRQSVESLPQETDFEVSEEGSARPASALRGADNAGSILGTRRKRESKARVELANNSLSENPETERSGEIGAVTSSAGGDNDEVAGQGKYNNTRGEQLNALEANKQKGKRKRDTEAKPIAAEAEASSPRKRTRYSTRASEHPILMDAAGSRIKPTKGDPPPIENADVSSASAVVLISAKSSKKGKGKKAVIETAPEELRKTRRSRANNKSQGDEATKDVVNGNEPGPSTKAHGRGRNRAQKNKGGKQEATKEGDEAGSKAKRSKNRMRIEEKPVAENRYQLRQRRVRGETA